MKAAPASPTRNVCRLDGRCKIHRIGDAPSAVTIATTLISAASSANAIARVARPTYRGSGGGAAGCPLRAGAGIALITYLGQAGAGPPWADGGPGDEPPARPSHRPCASDLASGRRPDRRS